MFRSDFVRALGSRAPILGASSRPNSRRVLAIPARGRAGTRRSNISCTAVQLPLRSRVPRAPSTHDSLSIACAPQLLCNFEDGGAAKVVALCEWSVCGTPRPNLRPRHSVGLPLVNSWDVSLTHRLGVSK